MPREIVTTAKRLLSVDLIDEKGLVVRFRGTDGLEHHIQFPTGEAYGLADMLAIVGSRLPAP